MGCVLYDGHILNRVPRILLGTSKCLFVAVVSSEQLGRIVVRHLFIYNLKNDNNNNNNNIYGVSFSNKAAMSRMRLCCGTMPTASEQLR